MQGPALEAMDEEELGALIVEMEVEASAQMGQPLEITNLVPAGDFFHGSVAIVHLTPVATEIAIPDTAAASDD